MPIAVALDNICHHELWPVKSLSADTEKRSINKLYNGEWIGDDVTCLETKEGRSGSVVIHSEGEIQQCNAVIPFPPPSEVCVEAGG